MKKLRYCLIRMLLYRDLKEEYDTTYVHYGLYKNMSFDVTPNFYTSEGERFRMLTDEERLQKMKEKKHEQRSQTMA